MRFAATFILMSLFWILISGLFDTLHLVLGLISCLIVSALMHKVMFESFEPKKYFTLLYNTICYIPWLLSEIITANLDLVYRTLHPSLPIKPQIITIRPGIKSDYAKTLLANSITLTPGTVTISSEGSEFTIHAIADKPATSLKAGEMQKRVAEMDL
jgi:multicomponent Na+:H+ antiporter subunit E